MTLRLRRRPATLAILASIGAALVWLRCGPLPPDLLGDRDRPSTIVLDRNGERLYEARSATGVRGARMESHAIPPLLASATMSAEDVRFRLHPGIDPIAVVRAAFHNVRAGRIVEGGSTISQQVAGLLLARAGEPPRGWAGKAREAIVALRLEHRLSKNEILALYLSLAPYGNQLEGAARASRAYFGRDAATLTAAEAAFLASLPQQPSRFNPWRDPERARARQQHVLGVMASRGWLTPAALEIARTERLMLTRESTALIAPHFVERVLASVGERHPREVRTTLDAELQRTVHGIIEAERPALDRHHASNVAVVVLDNRNGEWLAWEGSGNYFARERGGMIDGAATPRQPGSALKPFTYAAAFDTGVTPARVLADVPSHFPTAEPGVLYAPRNYDGQYRGPLLARVALAGSENVPAVALASEIGVPAIARLLRRAGLTTLDHNAAHYGLGLTLGNAEVRLDELTAAYAMFARGGETIQPRMIAAIDGTDERRQDARVRVLSTQTAFWVTDILADADARAYVFGRGGSLEFPFAVAAKTGTSQSYFDNWVVGYTRDVTVGVWVGNFDRTPLRNSSGVTGAGPIFHAVMLAAVERVRGQLPIGDPAPIAVAPDGLARREICAVSGLAPGDACVTRAVEWLPAGGHLPTCTWHHATDAGILTVWPAEYDEWARSTGRADAPRITAGSAITHAAKASPSPAARADAGGAELSIVRPLGGAVFLIDPTLRSEFQTLSFVARGGAPGELEWSVNDRVLQKSSRENPPRWALVPGRHTIGVRDATGRRASITIEVR